MADMGTDALQNIAQILDFLKIEKLHQLLSDEEELELLTADLLQQIREEGGALPSPGEATGAQRAARATGSPRDGEATAGHPTTSTPGPLAIQRVLARHGLADPAGSVSASPQKGTPGYQPSLPGLLSAQPTHSELTSRTEDYFLRAHPVELASISLKLLADTLVQLGMGTTAEGAPPQVL